MNIVKNSAIFVITIINFVFLSNAYARDFYVSTNGSTEGCTESSTCSLSYAQSEAVAGDTIYLNSGVYTQRIMPSNSGLPDKYITIKAAPGAVKWSVIITNSSYGAYLNNNAYIIIDGLYFKDTGSMWIELDSSDHNIIQNCKFYKSKAYKGLRIGNGDNYDGDGSDYNVVRECIFEDAPVFESGGYWDSECQNQYLNWLAYNEDCDRETAPADLLRIDHGIGNIIERNEFGNSSHDAICVTPYNHSPSYTVIRNNKITNTFRSALDINSFTLVEKNRIYKNGLNKDKNPLKASRGRAGGGIYSMTKGSIIRNNIVRDGDGARYLGAKASGATSINEKTYHNTFYNNWGQIKSFGNNQRAYYGNIFKNNIIFDDEFIIQREVDMPNQEYAILWNFSDSPYENDVINIYKNNSWTPGADTIYFKNSATYKKTLNSLKELYSEEWHSSNFYADPEFIDPKNERLDLKESSPLIDAGGWLTVIASSTENNVSSFTVEDSSYFYDGWEIPGEVGDKIKTSNGQVTNIIAIDYTTNKITVETPINIVKNEGISIFYLGDAPDLGAIEYNYLKAPILKIAASK